METRESTPSDRTGKIRGNGSKNGEQGRGTDLPTHVHIVPAISDDRKMRLILYFYIRILPSCKNILKEISFCYLIEA